MTPLTLYPEEIIQLQKGEVLVVRPVEPQPVGEIASMETADDLTWLFYDKEGFNQFRKHPFGPVGSEIAIVGSELSESFNIPDFIAIHEGTTAERLECIGLQDCLDAGITLDYFNGPLNELGYDLQLKYYREEFKKYWNSRHPDFPWQDNPWAWLGKLKLKGEG